MSVQRIYYRHQYLLTRLSISPKFHTEVGDKTDHLYFSNLRMKGLATCALGGPGSDFTNRNRAYGIVHRAAVRNASAQGAVRVSVRVGSCCESLAKSECAARTDNDKFTGQSGGFFVGKFKVHTPDHCCPVKIRINSIA